MTMVSTTIPDRPGLKSNCGLSFVSLLLLAGLLLSGAWLSGGQAQAQAASPSLEKLSIVSTQNGANKDNVFMVEVMRTVDERARGLMFRRYLPADRGMLFEFGAEAPVSMWMKDTFIPLDMLFIKKDGTIVSMALNTEPHSTRTIGTSEPVWSVLELNAGTAHRLGIKPGDVIVHPLFTGKK
jgi:uncharacterized membrane protein (UPF0127 family)